MGVLQEAERQAVEEELRAADLNRVLNAGISALRSHFPDIMVPLAGVRAEVVDVAIVAREVAGAKRCHSSIRRYM